MCKDVLVDVLCAWWQQLAMRIFRFFCSRLPVATSSTLERSSGTNPTSSCCDKYENTRDTNTLCVPFLSLYQTQKIIDEILVKFLIIPSQPFQPSVFDWTGSSKAISSRNLHESPAKRSLRQLRQQLSIFSPNHLKKWCRREIEFKT